MDVYLDVVRNGYDGLSPALKRRWTSQFVQSLLDNDKSNALARVKRHLRLPTVLIHKEDEFLPLLLETRATYIDGHFFSCVASAVTTADRICNRLPQYYNLSVSLQRWVLRATLGNKIYKLRAEGVITKKQEGWLKELNCIRNRHLHPKRPVSILTLKRDAFTAIVLLHNLLEGTFSVFRDHTFEQGEIVPKPLL